MINSTFILLGNAQTFVWAFFYNNIHNKSYSICYIYINLVLWNADNHIFGCQKRKFRHCIWPI